MPGGGSERDTIGHSHQDYHENWRDGEDQDVDGVSDADGRHAAELRSDEDVIVTQEADGDEGGGKDKQGHGQKGHPDAPNEALPPHQVEGDRHPHLYSEETYQPHLKDDIERFGRLVSLILSTNASYIFE